MAAPSEFDHPDFPRLPPRDQSERVGDSRFRETPPQALLCTYSVVYRLDTERTGQRQHVMVHAFNAELACEAVAAFHAERQSAISIIGVIDNLTLGLVPV